MGHHHSAPKKTDPCPQQNSEEQPMETEEGPTAEGQMVDREAVGALSCMGHVARKPARSISKFDPEEAKASRLNRQTSFRASRKEEKLRAARKIDVACLDTRGIREDTAEASSSPGTPYYDAQNFGESPTSDGAGAGGDDADFDNTIDQHINDLTHMHKKLASGHITDDEEGSL